MKLRALTGAVLVVVSVMLVAGCSRERIDWKSAEAADTQEAYNHFLERHPDSALAAQARTRLAQLAEDKDWQRASAADTSDAYKQFLAQHPSGKWAEEARIRVENFALDANPSPTSVAADASAAPPAMSAQQRAATDTRGASEVAQPGEPASARADDASRAERPPGLASKPAPVAPPTARSASESASRTALPPSAPSNSAPVAPASTASRTASTAANDSSRPSSAPKPAASPTVPKQTITTGPASKPVTTASTDNSGGYGIQLGAFSTQAAALNEWKRLQIAHDAELHGLFAHAVAVDVTSGKLYRLQSPVGDEGRARSICASLTKQQTPCVVVLPPEKR